MSTATPTVGPSQTPTSGPSPTPAATFTSTIPPTPIPTIFSQAAFTYDGDGKRVKSVLTTDIATTTTYFAGAHFEVANGVVTKYYYAGAQRIAMRANGTLNFLFGDHLGSTSLTTSATGIVISELRYKAWGEVRYASGDTPTKYTYTGQYSDSYINLLDYGSRRYDPELGRFIQPDSIVPLASQGVQAYDRYGYANNNPVRYTDPTGHRIDDGCHTEGCNLTQKQKTEDAQKLALLEKESNKRKCKGGNRNYCSGWDNWAWKNIPSSFGLQSGINIQLGLGLEGSYSSETAITFNWRSGQIASTSTTEIGGYFGAPHGGSLSGYGGIHTIRGMSNLKSLEGPDAFIEGSLSADAVAEVGISLQRSQSLTRSGGPQVIDPVSQMPQDTGELNFVLGVNAIPNAIDGGINIGESNSEITGEKIFDLYDWFE